MVLNLTPDKQHTAVVNAVMPLMKEYCCYYYYCFYLFVIIINR